MKDLEYRKRMANNPCTVAGLPPSIGCRDPRPCGTLPDRNKIEACHVKPFGSSRLDYHNIVPLCPRHHEEQEGKTEAFNDRYGVDLTLVAWQLYANDLERQVSELEASAVTALEGPVR